MIGTPLPLACIAKWTKGRIIGLRTMEIAHICIDSRQICARGLFIALPGTHTDGHNYIEQVLRGPATALLIRQNYYHAHRSAINGWLDVETHALVVVSDPLKALLRMAREYLMMHAPTHIIAITGSNGKTTVKEILVSVIKEYIDRNSEKDRVEHGDAVHGVSPHARDIYYTPANQNSAIGIPLAIMRINRAYRYLVVEVGTGYKGEIPAITRMLQPHVVVITNIGHAHIEAFKRQSAIAREKMSLAQKSADLRAWYIRYSDRMIVTTRKLAPNRPSFYDKDPWAMRVRYTPGRSGATVALYTHAASVELHGAFQYDNVRAVVAVAHYLSIPARDIVAGIARYRPLFGRMQIIEGDITVIFDCYNANPESTREALEYAQSISCMGKRICVLGAMKELGLHSARFHTEIFLVALEMGFEHIFCIGNEFSPVNVGAYPHAKYFADVDQAADALRAVLRKNDAVLLKGSRSMRLERLLPHIHTLKEQKSVL